VEVIEFVGPARSNRRAVFFFSPLRSRCWSYAEGFPVTISRTGLAAVFQRSGSGAILDSHWVQSELTKIGLYWRSPTNLHILNAWEEI